MGKHGGTPFSVPGGWPHPNLADAEPQERERRKLLDDRVLWRVEAVRYAVLVDPYESDDWTSTPPRLEMFGFAVLRWTPCGARIDEPTYGGGSRWVDLRPDRKQWASRTPADALEQFTLRRRAQIRILKRQLSRANDELRLADPVLCNA